MATRRPIVNIAGQLQEIPAGDTISATIAPGSGGGGASITTVNETIAIAVFGIATVLVADVGTTAASRIVGAQLQPNQDWEADDLGDLELTATPLVDQIEFTIHRPGPIVGGVTISYIRG